MLPGVSKVTWKKDSSEQHKKARNFKKPKGNNEQVKKCDRCGYNAHKPQKKCPAKNESCHKCRKIGHFAQVCRSRKSIVNLLNETDYSGDEYSSDEEGADRDLQLLHVASLEINRINNQNPGEMNEMLEGIDHAYAIMDDILITGRNVAHHDSVLEAVLQRAKSYNLRLNIDKVKVRKSEVQYVGHIISAEGLKPDPEKVKAMKDMPPPETKEDVRRFLGSIQYLAKFLPMLAYVETPLRELTRKEVIFHWDKPQADAFQKLKDMCCKAPVLAYYDVNKEVTIQCDASKEAVGAVLLQEGRPVAYASRKLRESEINWAPIEKEMLTIVFSRQKFREYILGKTIVVQTDHKPLETILRKPIATAPLRLQAMMLKVSDYDLKVARSKFLLIS